MSRPRPGYDFDIAVSYASEDRGYVSELVELLKSKGVKVFYDEDALAEIWGSNLIDFLQEVYNRRARFALLFISHHYVSKKWPSYERQSVQDRALNQAAPYLLPVRLDNSTLPGLHSSIAYIDARRVGIRDLSDLVIRKLAAEPLNRTARPTASRFNGRVPHTSQEIETGAALLE